MIFQGRVLGYGDIAYFDTVAITQARVVDDILFVRSNLGETPVEISTISIKEESVSAIMIVNEDLEVSGYLFEAGSQWACVFMGMHGNCYRVKFGGQVLHVPQGVVRLEYENN